MKLNTTPRLAVTDPVVQREFREHAVQVNLLSEGRLSASYAALAAAPASGTYAQGDFVRNAAPTEAGTSGAKYVVTGWVCVIDGTPGTFVECRSLTGN
ncbi:hypothetical protein UFOVP73_57 [uncultured Caudovirales phage]|uniref:Uncharacterized protein n=1 Tax=uncultured Caudovirales phage TaxID=2100421 RepID=A0A6J5KYT3_9CAUD|nr:hypothetical protein UFOVP73_57 [uncultured Caudovirales phage]CAB5194696.1 hypothetical protein UFOVP170_17 [uncultured Caudovirales phage]